MYTTGDPTLDETPWKELVWTLPDDDQLPAPGDTVTVPIDGENFSPDTKYTVKVIPHGEIDGLPSDPVTLETGDGSQLFSKKGEGLSGYLSSPLWFKLNGLK